MMMTKTEIAGELRALGLRAGDAVLLHSSLSSLGPVEGGADAVVAAFLEVLGETGTLAVPAFGKLGVIVERVKAHPRVVVSVHPLAAVAAIGAGAEAFCRDHWKAELAHGPDTPYTRLAEAGGYVCLLGVDQDRNTTLHTAEELLRLPYLKTTPEQTFDTPEGSVTRAWPFFPGPHRDFIGLDRLFRESGKMTVGRIGRAVVRLIKGRDLIALAVEALRRDPAAVLCANSACADCVAQRAAIRQARLSAESFRLVVSAQLAGRNVPEIVEQCRRAGVGAVEFDGLQGKPVEILSDDTLVRAVEALRAEGIDVTAIRACSVGARAVKQVARAAACGVRRMVMPLDAALATEAVAAAREHGIELSFYNTVQDSDTVSVMLREIAGRNLRVGFTFNAPRFAGIGEKPFLGSFRKTLRRQVDQLDVSDGLLDGTPRPLTEGQAEIKELVSILRCAGFDGPLVLTAQNRQAGDTLPSAVHRFISLLDAI